MTDYIKTFSEIDINDINIVGGKNASLGEMFQKLTPKGVNIPDGFAVTSQAYWKLLEVNRLYDPLKNLFRTLDTKNFSNLSEVGKQARQLILDSEIPAEIQDEIVEYYRDLEAKYDFKIQVAVRSSATAEDLPTASFAGQQETYLNIRNEEDLIDACKKCYASLFTDRAIKYREDNNFHHMKVALSIGIQKMVRSDKACSGVGFTIDTETGFEKVVFLTGSWGLGENVVQGTVNPDEFYIFKPALKRNKKSIISKKLGSKSKTMIYAEDIENHVIEADKLVINVDTPDEKRKQFIMNDEEIEKIAKWSMIIEEHYRRPMDIEWAKDGLTSELFIVQARSETVFSSKKEPFKIYDYKLKKRSKILAMGKSVGNKIAAGRARVLSSPEEAYKLQKGEILVASITTPDWDPILKKASAIVTDKGGRTSHAAIVAREVGAVAIVGTGNATQVIQDGQEITVSCLEGENGIIYDGILDWDEEEINTKKIKMPKTMPMLILGDPDQAFKLSFLPNKGVGLMRLEFVISNAIKIHPMALVKFNKLEDLEAKAEIEEITYLYEDKEEYFVDQLSQAVAMIAAAFYPNDVIVRMSDFKTNEYANLIGGKEFEPLEENPMLGFRGASRYYNIRYKEGFALECKAMKRVREDMGLDNVKLMIPFCRTIEEGKKVLNIMETYGLKRGENHLEVYVMIEIPSNVILAEEFSKIFDGFSIGSNDLTQLTLGIDRDSSIINKLFNEQDEAVKILISQAIKKAKTAGIKIGLCGQAPSDYPAFAEFLVKEGIDSISFNSDALIRGIGNMNEAEAKLKKIK
ncbi:MAG: phosphoenolpyruvate synthase [Candidatus Melainabacteria bacterium GWA2_34_9]|nr:MAG: phosphoenolpyruvate synthase [Candidatus Melainabacteria bacterium GWA2_34_9]